MAKQLTQAHYCWWYTIFQTFKPSIHLSLIRRSKLESGLILGKFFAALWSPYHLHLVQHQFHYERCSKTSFTWDVSGHCPQKRTVPERLSRVMLNATKSWHVPDGNIMLGAVDQITTRLTWMHSCVSISSTLTFGRLFGPLLSAISPLVKVHALAFPFDLFWFFHVNTRLHLAVWRGFPLTCIGQCTVETVG